MPTPNLPPLAPPPIPAGRVSVAPGPKKGPSFLTIMMLTILIVWTYNLLTRNDAEQPLVSDAPPPTATPPQPMPIPTGEEAEQLRESLPAADRSALEKKIEPTFVTLGSADPKSPYRFLVTLSNRGAAVARIEMNERAYRDCSDTTGYLGQIIVNESVCDAEISEEDSGVAVQVAGHGTPAALAGLVPGDRILSLEAMGESVPITSFESLRAELLKTKPGETIRLGVRKKSTDDEKPQEPQMVEVTLGQAPLSIVRPEGVISNYADYKNLAGLSGSALSGPEDYFPANMLNPLDVERKNPSDPLSFLMTLAEYDEKDRLDWPILPPNIKKNRWTSSYSTLCRSPQIEQELSDLSLGEDGAWEESTVAMRRGLWEYLADESDETSAVFRKILLGRKLEIRKTYSVTPNESDGKKKTPAEEYHLELSVEIKNLDGQNPHTVAYYLDGPTGLPIEGAWYSSGRKTGPAWGLYGLRDVVLGLHGGRSSHVVQCRDIALDSKMPSDPVDLDYLGVDSQYFQCSLLPEKSQGEAFLAEYMPIRVGACVKEFPNFANTSFRMKSHPTELAAAGQSGDAVSQSFKIFAGPKRQSVLDAYGLGDTLVYGWLWFVSKPLAAVLHFFHAIVFSYGVAIILLTILVRVSLFPLSMKQVVSSLKMQKIQPQLNAMKEKYKDNPQEMMAQQQALWRKHKINPLGGCLPLFIQMPIFIGLYKTLSLDVNLYGAPLFSESIRWCGNLAAPDMLADWSGFWNQIGWPGFNLGQGMFALGPYFNLLPILTIILFLLQQKFLMPPPSGTDAEQAQQRSMRRMMNFMMLFMGLMFFKVPSGLCVYFIASSLWGLLERRFHPKIDLTEEGELAVAASPVRGNPFGSFGNNQKNGGETHSRSKKDRRTRTQPTEKPTGWKSWWNDLLEKAKTQQKLAKAETERRNKTNRKKR